VENHGGFFGALAIVRLRFWTFTGEEYHEKKCFFWENLAWRRRSLFLSSTRQMQKKSVWRRNSREADLD